MAAVKSLPVSELYKICREQDLAQVSSNETVSTHSIIGQERAIQAVEFAVNMPMDGHNIFVLGPPGTGRRTFTRQVLSTAAAEQPTPTDWCYVNNFDDPHCPLALELPAGMGKQFAETMEECITEVRSALTAAFGTDNYRAQYKAIEAEFQDEQKKQMEAVHQHAKELSIRIIPTAAGMIFAPIRDGEVVGPDEFEKLTEEEQKIIEKDANIVSAELQKNMEAAPRQIRKVREKIAELDMEITRFSVGNLMRDLLAEYAQLPRIVEFLGHVEKDLISNSALIRQEPDHSLELLQVSPEMEMQRRYSVNVIVNRIPASAAPVVVEERCNYAQLVGRVEHRAQMGTLTTDFTLIRSGALHRANGGYLILDARRLLSEPFAWEGLKQALNTGCIKTESLAEVYSLTTTVALEPEPIPLKVKVALIGDRRLYFLLQALDPDFDKLFKIAADFDDRMDRTLTTQRDFSDMMSAIVDKNSLHSLSQHARCRVIEESARRTGDRNKLSTEIRYTEDLLREGNYWANKKGRTEITAEDIDAAIESREYRHGRIRERVVEEITRGSILIDTKGFKTGQINGLAVHQMGDFSFGRPSRISARVSPGTGKIIDIEREAELGGSLHSKGVLILSGFIAANYVKDKPLSLSATIAFEQSYGGVDGDSASSAELYALLSAICDVPLSQSLAVTGSVNQLGDVQAIGGVNEKIEGFFDICDQRGLTGKQGVLIPTANVKHLMLRKRVINAVQAGKFSVYPISHIDEGLSILTGLVTGIVDHNGNFPTGTLNEKIRTALQTMAEQRLAQSHEKYSEK